MFGRWSISQHLRICGLLGEITAQRSRKSDKITVSVKPKQLGELDPPTNATPCCWVSFGGFVRLNIDSYNLTWITTREEGNQIQDQNEQLGE